MELLYIAISKCLILLFVSPSVVGIIRKVKAWMQNRRGASVLQPYREIWKLLHKDEMIAHDASWIFYIAPYIIFSISLLLITLVPVASLAESISGFSTILLFVGLNALAVFFLALSAIDTGSTFGGFGASREMTLTVFAEGALLFSFIPVTILTHTQDLIIAAGIASNMQYLQIFPLSIAFIGFSLSMVSETGRIPFDNPATHLELTMIHEAMILEYSGKRLGLLEWAAGNKIVVFLVLGANLFFPWTITGHTDVGSIVIAFLWTIMKVIVFACIIAVIESSMPRLRFFRLPKVLFIAILMGIISILAITL